MCVYFDVNRFYLVNIKLSNTLKVFLFLLYLANAFSESRMLLKGVTWVLISARHFELEFSLYKVLRKRVKSQ